MHIKIQQRQADIEVAIAIFVIVQRRTDAAFRRAIGIDDRGSLRTITLHNLTITRFTGNNQSRER
ncbi:hypothetical protein D3C78_1903480 [compost metagenome]